MRIWSFQRPLAGSGMEQVFFDAGKPRTGTLREVVRPSIAASGKEAWRNETPVEASSTCEF